MNNNLYEYIDTFLSNRKNSFLFGDIDGKLSNELANKIINVYGYQIDKYKKSHDAQLSVAILLPRKVTYLAAILGCWKTGNYYIPLNEEWPNHHIEKILCHQKPDILITDRTDLTFDGHIIRNADIDTNIEVPARVKKEWKNRSIHKGLAYIIYTSGSTGDPKGVMISKDALVEYFKWVEVDFKELRDVRSLIINGEISFDISIADLAFAIVNKIQVFISPSSRDILTLIGMIAKHRIESIYAVPTTLTYICNILNSRIDSSLSCIKTVFSGGDVLTPQLVIDIMKFFPNAVVYNMYGPTEVTMNCMSIKIDKSVEHYLHSDAVPTGRIPNHMHWLFSSGNLISDSIKEGELLIAGKQLMNGYYKEPALSRDSQIIFSNKVFYKTGDFFKKEGDIFFYQGRKDNLVKIHGYRINTSDITSVIVSHPNILEGVALAVNISETYELVVFFKAVNFDFKITNLIEQLKLRCADRLPKYMLPKFFFELNELPTGLTGKYDVNLLCELALQKLKAPSGKEPT